MTFDFTGSVAVLTGAGSGIGRASAMAFARRGARIVVTDIDGDRASAVAAEIGNTAVSTGCDVTDLDNLSAVRDLALGEFGRIDVVMNNVGVLAVGAARGYSRSKPNGSAIVDINLHEPSYAATWFSCRC